MAIFILSDKAIIPSIREYSQTNSYEIFYDSTRKRWSLNTGDYVIEVTAWAGLTVYRYYVD